MTKHSESTKIKMLCDAMMPLTPLAENYLKLVDFVKYIAIATHLGNEYYRPSDNAKELLKEIGELE